MAKRFVLPLFLGLASGWVQADDGQADMLAQEEESLSLAYGDRNFVSIATGTRQHLSKSPSSTTVITAEDIANMGATTLSEVLVGVPGMHIARNTLQSSYAPTYGMRGILTGTSPHVLMMVNGIPRTSVYLGNPDEQRVELPVENIARIEVIRGPGSAVYGADAFAGTINIITKTAADIKGTQVAVRGASFNGWDALLQHGGNMGDAQVAAFLRIGSSDGQTRQIDRDAVGRSGPVNLNQDLVDGQVDISREKFRWRASYTLRDNLGRGVGIASALDPASRVRSERQSTDLSWHDPQFAQDFGLTLQAAYFQMSNVVTVPLTVIPGGVLPAFPNGVIGIPDKWERQTRLSASSVYTGIPDHRIRAGFGQDWLSIYKTSETKNFTLIPTLSPRPMYQASGDNLYLAPHQRQVTYAYAQDEWSFARNWTLTGGVRYDHYSDIGGTTNPRVALVWEPQSEITGKLMYGTAFRAPSFVEQYATGNPIALGNPSLTPERIRTLEGGLTWQPRYNFQTALSVFRHNITDLIGQSGSSYVNAGQQKGYGSELEITWLPTSSLRVSGYYAYQKNRDLITNQDAGFAPHHRLYTRVEWKTPGNWTLSGQANFVGDRARAAGDPRPQLPDYTTVDITVRSPISKDGWDFSASVHNLFNADVREPAKYDSKLIRDYPMPGRTFWLQARYSL